MSAPASRPSSRPRSRYDDLVNRFSTSAPGRWLGRNVISRIDPLIFKATKRRYTSTGKPTLPMLALTTTGRRTGQKRTVQLAYVADGGDWVVVASNWGQQHHPAWSHNLDADPDARVLVEGDDVAVRAELLPPEEKQRLWPEIERVVPQQKVYPSLTDRTFKVYRLTRR